METGKSTGPGQALVLFLALLFTTVYQQPPSSPGPLIMQKNGDQIRVIQPQTGRLLVGNAPRKNEDSVLIEVNPGSRSERSAPEQGSIYYFPRD